MSQECKVVYETVCPSSANTYSNSYSNNYSNSYSNSYNFPKRRKKRTVALVRNLFRAKQNIWSRKKKFVRNILGLNNRGSRRVQGGNSIKKNFGLKNHLSFGLRFPTLQKCSKMGSSDMSQY